VTVVEPKQTQYQLLWRLCFPNHCSQNT